MDNSESRFATDAFGGTIVRCIGCGGWTSSLDEVCECCVEQGLSRDLILMEQEWEFHNYEDVNDDFPLYMEYEDQNEFMDYDEDYW